MGLGQLLHAFEGAIVQFQGEAKRFGYRLVGDIVMSDEQQPSAMLVRHEGIWSHVGPMPPEVTTKS